LSLIDSNLYPEIINYLKRQVEKGKEAEKLLQSDNQILPVDLLEKLIEKGKESQLYLERLKLSRNEPEPQGKYYTKEFPSGPWSRYLYQVRTGKPFNEKEFRKDYYKYFRYE